MAYICYVLIAMTLLVVVMGLAVMLAVTGDPKYGQHDNPPLIKSSK